MTLGPWSPPLPPSLINLALLGPNSLASGVGIISNKENIFPPGSQSNVSVGQLVATTAIPTVTAIFLAGQAGPAFGVALPTSDAGDIVGAITVTTNIPGIYTGTITIGGTNASDFSLNATSNVLAAAYPCTLYVAQSVLPANTYAISLTALP